jgi:hypothetical protein
MGIVMLNVGVAYFDCVPGDELGDGVGVEPTCPPGTAAPPPPPPQAVTPRTAASARYVRMESVLLGRVIPLLALVRIDAER